LQEYLGRAERARPTVVDRAPGEGQEGRGRLAVSFAEGALLLRDAQGRRYRLSWEEPAAEGRTAAEERALPAGTYDLMGIRLARRDAAGHEWLASLSAPSLQCITLRAGETTRLEVDERVELQAKLVAQDPGHVAGRRLQVSVRGAFDGGLTLYRGGARIGIEYRLRDAAGELRQTGRLRYG
jgi:hypothetical protein